jgi:hypothetical protein
MMPKIKASKITLLVFIVLAIALFVNLDRTPPPWWDEGWTLTIARTWAEHGVFARLSEGKLAPSGLSASPPTTAIVTLAFRFLGVGVMQSRLPIAVVTLLSLVVVYYLVLGVYGRQVALATLVVGPLMSMHPQANPITMGRQVLAEPLMLLLFVVGALFLFLGLERSFWFFPLAMISWGVAAIVKAQFLPFWAVSLAIPLGVALLKRQWRMAVVLTFGLAGGYLAYRECLVALYWWLSPQIIAEIPFSGLVETVAFVPVLSNRVLAVSNVLKFELPLLLALAYGGWMVIRDWSRPHQNENAKLVQLALWSFAASWLAWYLLLANAGIPRYLYPTAFVGSIFVAVLVRDLTGGFDLRGTVKRAALMLDRRRVTAEGLGALGAISLTALAVPFTLLMLGWFYLVDTNTSAQQMAQYIDSHLPVRAIVESYDSELFFFLNHPYHYPPDQTHVDLIRRTLDPSVPIRYDPLAAEADYLVVGPFGSGWHLYDGVLAEDAFRLIETKGEYRLYERIR